MTNTHEPPVPTANDTAQIPKKQILLNAFDMFTPGHLSPGQWKNPSDRSTTKFESLDYWINLAKLLEKGGINALFLADTYGGYDTYEGSLDECVRRGAQWPVGDPIIVSCFFLKSYSMMGKWKSMEGKKVQSGGRVEES